MLYVRSITLPIPTVSCLFRLELTIELFHTEEEEKESRICCRKLGYTLSY